MLITVKIFYYILVTANASSGSVKEKFEKLYQYNFDLSNLTGLFFKGTNCSKLSFRGCNN